MNPTRPADRLLRTDEVTAFTGVPEGTLRYWVSCGRGPASFKLGNRRVYRESAVTAWLAAAEKGQAV